MELFTVGYHTGLDGLRVLNTVASRGGSSRLLGSRGRRVTADEANADVHASLHAATITANGRIPFHKIRETNLLVACDLAASHARCYVVGFVAVGDHA